MRYPFQKDDAILARITASTTEKVILLVAVEFEDGSKDVLEMDVSHTAGDRVPRLVTSDKNFAGPGEVVGLAVDVRGSSVKRGEYFLTVFVRRGNELTVWAIFSGYISTTFFGGLGYFEDSVSGHGHFRIVTIANDVAGDVDTDVALALANVLRRVLGFIFYYNTSGDVDTRTMIVDLRRPGGAFPTGTEISGSVMDQWRSGTMQLTAGQGGVIYSYGSEGKDGLTSLNDDGALTFLDTASSPTPWPIMVSEDDLATLNMDITTGNANDRYSAYLFVEEWIQE